MNVEMDMFDDPDKYPDIDVSLMVEKLFQEHYLGPLGDDVSYVRLESMLGAIVQVHVLMILSILWQKCTRKIAAVTVLLRRRLQH